MSILDAAVRKFYMVAYLSILLGRDLHSSVPKRLHAARGYPVTLI